MSTHNPIKGKQEHDFLHSNDVIPRRIGFQGEVKICILRHFVIIDQKNVSGLLKFSYSKNLEATLTSL